MIDLVTQRDELGCGLACAALVAGVRYEDMRSLTEEGQSKERGFYCREIAELLGRFDHGYNYRYVNQKSKPLIYREGSIVYLRKSKKYPRGHFLVRWHGVWMDPWVNFRLNQDIEFAHSGYRKRLPEQPIYVVYKELE